MGLEGFDSSIETPQVPWGHRDPQNRGRFFFFHWISIGRAEFIQKLQGERVGNLPQAEHVTRRVFWRTRSAEAAHTVTVANNPALRGSVFSPLTTTMDKAAVRRVTYEEDSVVPLYVNFLLIREQTIHLFVQ